MSGECRRKGGVRGELRVWMWRRGPWRAASVNAGGFHGELAPSNDDVRLEREGQTRPPWVQTWRRRASRPRGSKPSRQWSIKSSLPHPPFVFGSSVKVTHLFIYFFFCLGESQACLGFPFFFEKIVPLVHWRSTDHEFSILLLFFLVLPMKTNLDERKEREIFDWDCGLWFWIKGSWGTFAVSFGKFDFQLEIWILIVIIFNSGFGF